MAHSRYPMPRVLGFSNLNCFIEASQREAKFALHPSNFTKMCQRSTRSIEELHVPCQFGRALETPFGCHEVALVLSDVSFTFECKDLCTDVLIFVCNRAQGALQWFDFIRSTGLD